MLPFGDVLFLDLPLLANGVVQERACAQYSCRPFCGVSGGTGALCICSLHLLSWSLTHLEKKLGILWPSGQWAISAWSSFKGGWDWKLPT